MDALDAVGSISGSEHIHAAGYCLAGLSKIHLRGKHRLSLNWRICGRRPR